MRSPPRERAEDQRKADERQEHDEQSTDDRCEHQHGERWNPDVSRAGAAWQRTVLPFDVLEAPRFAIPVEAALDRFAACVSEHNRLRNYIQGTSPETVCPSGADPRSVSNAPESGALIRGEVIMLRIRSSLLGVLLIGTFAAPALAADGKAVFLDKKCNKCHTVSSASIEKTSKLKAPDLTTEAISGDAKVLKAYLKKVETINGKKHSTAFAGTDDELDAVIAWVLQQSKAKR